MGTVDLDGIPLFGGLTPDERARAASVARQLHWEVGHVALNEGEFAFDFYAIKRGAAEVHHAGETVATLGVGDFFGEIGLLPGAAAKPSRRRSATVVVTAPTEAIAISGSDMRRLTQEMPVLRDALTQAAAARSQL